MSWTLVVSSHTREMERENRPFPYSTHIPPTEAVAALDYAPTFGQELL